LGADSTGSRRTLIDAYLEQGDNWIEELGAAIRAGDHGQVRLITHTLSSSSELLGALALAELLTHLGALVGPEHVEHVDLAPVATRVFCEYVRVAAVLRALRDSPTGPSPSPQAGSHR
jgi:hypothetical protein